MRSADIKGLPVISILEGREIGRVRDLLINGESKSVDYLVVDLANDYLRAYVLPLHLVEGIGVDAVMVESADMVRQLNDVPDGIRLVQSGVRLVGIRVLTRKGRTIGKISEYYIDEENGRITGCEMIDAAKAPVGIIPAPAALTFGKDALVVNEDVEQHLLTDIQDLQTTGPGDAAPPPAPQIRLAEAPQADIASAQPSDESSDPVHPAPARSSAQTKTAELFLQKQREYLLGRKAKKDIMDADGSALIKAGEVITEEIVVQATLANKFKELMHNS